MVRSFPRNVKVICDAASRLDRFVVILVYLDVGKRPHVIIYEIHEWLRFDELRKYRVSLQQNGVGTGFTSTDPILPKGRAFHAARSCFVNINNSFFLNIAYFGAEDGF